MKLSDKMELLKRMIIVGDIIPHRVMTEIGVDKKILSRLKLGTTDISNMRLSTAEQLADYLNNYFRKDKPGSTEIEMMKQDDTFIIAISEPGSNFVDTYTY